MIEIIGEWIIERLASAGTLEFVVSSILLCFLSCLHLRLLCLLYQLKFSRRQETRFLVVFSLFQILNYFLFPIVAREILFLIFLSVCVHFLFRLSASRILFLNCILGIIVALLDMIYANIIKIYEVNEIETIILLKEMFLCFFIFIESCILIGLKKRTISFIKESYKFEDKKSILCMSVFLIIVLLYTMKDVYYKEITVQILIQDISFLLFYMIVTFTNIHRRSKYSLQEQRIETLELHNKTLNLCTMNVKNFQNDFNSILQDIGGYIKYNDFDSLKIYYHAIIEEYKDIKSLSILNPTIINESAIYNIISNKYYLAKNYGVEVDMEFFIDFTKLNIKAYELARILGILLDNAIESANKCKEKQVSMSFQKGEIKDKIKISNTYNNQKLDIAKIFEKNFTTKENHHGLGLWEIKQILEKHSNLELYTSNQENIFLQELYIYHSY